MKWENNMPFYKQNLFWIGTTAFFMLLALLSRNKNQIIICGNNNGSDNTSKGTTPKLDTQLKKDCDCKHCDSK